MSQKIQIRILGIPVLTREISSSSETREQQNYNDYLQKVFGFSTLSGVIVNEEQALTLSAVWSCVKVLSETIAALPLNVFVRDIAGNRQIDRSNPLQYLLHKRPNNLMNSYAFRETIMLHKILSGNGYSIIHRDSKGVIGELELVVNPNQMYVSKSRLDGRKYYSYNGKVYADYEILHIMGMSRDGIKGISPIQYARENLGTAVALQNFGSNFFRNGARMSGVVEVPGKMNETSWKNIKDSWNNEYSGVNNVGKTSFLEGGMKYTPIALTNEDAQYLLSRKFSIEEIARIFRVPLHMINSLDKATNNNIEHQGIEFVQHTITPHIVSWEQELDSKLIPYSDRDKRYVKFNMNALMRGDSAARATYFKEMFYAGAMNPNEIRENEELNHYDGGDIYFVPVNMQNIKQAGNPSQA